MKRETRYLSVPLSLWDSQDLTWMEKALLIEIDSYPRSASGANIRPGSLAAQMGITRKECGSIIKSLVEKGAVQVNVEDGQNLMLPLMYKDEYRPSGETLAVDGEKPSESIVVDYDEVAAEWAECCPDLPPIARWTPQRKRKFRACMKQAALTLSDMYKVFRLVGLSSFLCGRNGGEWRCTFDWLIKSAANATKVYEGAYHNRGDEKRIYDMVMQGDFSPAENSGKEKYWQ